MNSAGFNNYLTNEFHTALKYTYHPTIDIFLEKKKIFREIGAYVIARTLIAYENDNNLFPHRDWYGDIFNIFNFESEIFEPSYPSFVSLNYDRSFEHFLNKNIDYNCQDEKVELCHKKRLEIKIVHAHGSLGKYPDVPYGLDANDTSIVNNAAENIRIVSDRLDDSPDFQEARQIISNAANVVFFGFGYDKITLSKLLGEPDLSSKTFYGTGINITPEIKTMLQNKFPDNFVLGDKLSCRQLLEEIRIASNNEGV